MNTFAKFKVDDAYLRELLDLRRKSIVDLRQWKVLDERPGPFHSTKAERTRQYNQRYGEGNWQVVWKVGPLFYDFLGECTFFEDAYFDFFRRDPNHLEWILDKASDVYDISKSDVESGFDYKSQNGAQTHIQDIAIRRIVKLRLKTDFAGDELVRVRSKGSNGDLVYPFLSPFSVPFHIPEWIDLNPLHGTFKEGSVEQQYQSAKRIAIRV